ncbi:hypothetical protein APF79_06375 [bacterium BRH_c32]|nr:MAG: hypothetical protein APF79_06375 [bacterium BRH_c32]
MINNIRTPFINIKNTLDKYQYNYYSIFMKKIILVLMLLSVPVSAQKLIYPDIPRDRISDLTFLSDSVGYLINYGGSLYRTNDGGTSWKLQKHFQNYYLTMLRFLDEKTGFIASENYNYTIPRRFYYTTDAGLSWNSNELFFGDAIDFLPVSQQKILKADRDGNIAMIDNFYGNWKTVYSMPTFIDSSDEYSYERPKGNIKQLIKLEDKRILAAGNYLDYFDAGKVTDSLSFILQSKKEGEKWDTLWQGLNKLINCIAFADSNTGWIAGDNIIYKTTNGGKDWKPQSPDAKIYYVGRKLYAIDSLTAFMLPDAGNLYFFTVNGGKNWILKNIETNYDNEFYFIDRKKAFVFGSELYSTEDGGENWKDVRKSISDNIMKIDFVSPKKGFAAGFGNIYRTIDGGYSWDTLFTSSSNSMISDFEMVDSLNGFVISGGEIYETNNGWSDWKEVSFKPSSFFSGGIHFLDSKIGIIFNAVEESIPGSHNYDLKFIYITDDGGKNWIKKKIDINDVWFPYNIKFIDKDNIICAAQDGIWKSSDRGDTWIMKYDLHFNVGSGFDFYKGKYGFIPSYSTNYYYTTDGGESYTEKTKKSLVTAYDSKFIGTYVSGAERVIEIGSHGAGLIHYLNYNYEDSYQINTFTGLDLYSISVFVDGNRPHVWMAGSGFNIIYREYELIVKAEKELELPSEYRLFQNYPNPFNPSTTIEYKIPREGNVKLEVYNSLGELVNVLVNSNQSTGNYKIVWNGKDSFGSPVSSGIYFYRITSGSFSQVNKMILMK